MQSYDFYFIYMCVCVLKFDIQCISPGGAVVSAAPTKQTVLSTLLMPLRGCSSLCCTNKAGGAIYSVGAFLLCWCT